MKIIDMYFGQRMGVGYIYTFIKLSEEFLPLANSWIANMQSNFF